MGCKYACVCGGSCPDCPGFEPEAYVGEAEDIYDRTYGHQPQPEVSIDAYIDEYIKGNTSTEKEADNETTTL